MFVVQSAGDETEDERVFAIKPMNCPGHVQIFKHGLKSYRDLPLRLAEFGAVHRYEPSGALHGLMRVRGFTQDDAHIFCTEEQIADECLKINDLILSTYADFGFDEIVVKLSTRPEKRVGTDEMWDHAEDVMTRVLKQIEEQSGGRIKTGDQPGRGRVLRAEVRIRAARRHRPRLAMRHHAGGLQPAGALRRVLRRCGRPEEDAGHGPSRDLRLDGALHRHPDRAFRRPFPALARAGAGGGRHHHLGGDDYASEVVRRCATRRACASRRTCATRRSTTRSASIRSPRCRCFSWWAARKPRSARSRSAASAARTRQTMTLDEALKALAAEAVTPDLRRAAKAVSEPEGHVTLDGHHVVERTVA